MSKSKKINPAVGLELMMIFVFMMLFLVIADQLIKRYIVFSMDYQSSVPLIENFFSLHYVRNTGSAFSFLADKAWGVKALSYISAILGGLVVILMGVACAKRLKMLAFAFCLIASGAFGNLIDRVYHKYVIDYLRFDFGDYTFPIFNFADICAVIGTFILMLIILFGHKYFDAFWGSSDKKKAKKAKKAKVKADKENSVPEETETEKEPEDENDNEDETFEPESGEEDEQSDTEENPELPDPYKVRPGIVNWHDGDDEA